MAAIMISVDGINCENLSCNKRGVHIWETVNTALPQLLEQLPAIREISDVEEY